MVFRNKYINYDSSDERRKKKIHPLKFIMWVGWQVL